MSFRSVFIAIVIGFGLVLAGFLINLNRPRSDTEQASATFVRATGKCAECHAEQQHSIVHEYELSVHAKKSVGCLDCHQAAEHQDKMDLCVPKTSSAGRIRRQKRWSWPGASRWQTRSR